MPEIDKRASEVAATRTKLKLKQKIKTSLFMRNYLNK